MKNVFKFLGIAVLAAFFLTNCPNPVGLNGFSDDRSNNNSGGSGGGDPPSGGDVDPDNRFIRFYDDTKKEITIAAKPGENGTITVHYKGILGTSYSDTEAPKDPGNYSVTYDVAASGYEITGLYAGLLVIYNLEDWLEKQTAKNTTPYTVYWEGNGDTYNLGYVSDKLNLAINNEKYVNLDLSGCNVTSIEGSTFYGCENLTGITIPNSVTIIGGGAFSGCKNLKSITIPNSVKEIKQEAFYSSGLTAVTIPGSVKTIGQNAFGNCKDLKKVEIENGVKEIQMEAFSYSGVTILTIPNSVTIIGKQAFAHCSLTNIIILDGVEIIENEAFIYNDIESIIIGENIKYIGDLAFGYCDKINTVIFRGKIYYMGFNPGAFERGSGWGIRDAFYSDNMYLESYGIPGKYEYDSVQNEWIWTGPPPP